MTAAIAAVHPNAALASALLAPGLPRRPCIQVAAINATRPPSATPATYTSPLSRQRLPATAMQQARAKEVPLTAPARYLLTPSACVAGPGAARHQTATNAHQNAHGSPAWTTWHTMTGTPPASVGAPRPGCRTAIPGMVTGAATATGPSLGSPSGLPSVRARRAPSEALPPGGAAAPARPARPRSAGRHYNLPHDQLTLESRTNPYPFGADVT